MSDLQWRKELGAVIGLGAAVAVFFWPAATLQGAFFVQDIMVQNYPFRDFFAQALQQGKLPLWNAAINCGFPLFAEGQAGALYPPNIVLALMLPTWAALNLNVVLHLWLGAVGIYALVRSFGAVPAAGLCAGLCYALSGYMAIRVMSPNYIDVCAWIPILLLLVDRALARRQWIYLLLFALVVCLQLLAGHPQATVYGFGAVFCYGVFRVWAQGAGWRLLVAMVAAPVLGIMLAGVQLLPTVELVQLSNRGTGLTWDHFVAMSLPPERIITLLLPNFFGNSAHGTYWSREVGFFIQLCAYIGVLPLVFAWVAVRERRDGHTPFFAALAIVGVLLALGKYTAFFSLLYEVPGLSFFRIPTRFLLWFALGGAVLCGMGVDQVLRVERRRRANAWLLCLLLGAVAGGGLYVNGVNLLGFPAGTGIELTRYCDQLRIDIIRLLLVLTLSIFFLGFRARKVVVWLAPLAIFAELYSFGADFNATIEPDAYIRTPATAHAILDDHGEKKAPPRIIGLVSEKTSPFNWHGGWVYDLWSYRRYTETLRIYSGGLYGLANALPGWSPLHLHRHGEFALGYPAFAPLAAIDYIVSYGEVGGRGMKLLFGGDIAVYRFTETMPRAYMVGQFHNEADLGRRQAYMARGFAIRDEVVLEEMPVERVGSGGDAQITRYENEQVEIALGKHDGGLLVLADTYYPGWRVYIDGVEGLIMRANHVFRAVVVPAGARAVVFIYEPASFRYGLMLSMGTALLWLALATGSRRWSFPLVRPLPIEAGTSLMVWALQGALIAVLHAYATQGEAWSAWIERARLGLGA